MNSIALTHQGFNLRKYIHEAFCINRKEYAEDAVIDKEKLNEALYSTSYNLMILENKWVKGIFQFIYGIELCERLNIDKNKILDINRELNEKGICKLSTRAGFLKKIEYQITGFWDY